MWSRGSRKASARERAKELGHPILAFTIAHVLPEAHCPLTVGLCKRAWHSLSYYTASPTRKHRKGARVNVGEAERMGRKNIPWHTHQSLLRGLAIMLSTVLEYIGVVKGRSAITTRGVGLVVVSRGFCCFVFVYCSPLLKCKPNILSICWANWKMNNV